MNYSRVDRRRFLSRTASVAVGGVGISAGCFPSRIAHAAPGAAELIPGKDARLIVHNANPAEIETPLALLAENAITPAALLFVRNNQHLDDSHHLGPIASNDWRIEIAGQVEKQASISLLELARLEQIEHELVLQCSGNGRAMFSLAAPAKGAPWSCGAMGNVRFAGVPLAKVFEHLQLKIDPRAQFVTAAGRDAPAKPGEADFEHSIPLDDALARSIIALRMNGEPIPAIHGGPVRLVTPGYYATMNVKWLGQLRLEAQETANYHQVGRYRTPKIPLQPGSEFTSTLANSDPNWRMRVKSVIFAPLDGARVPPGPTEVRGVAWNDGSAKIETVLVTSSTDRPWQRAVVESASPYAWQPWRITLDMPAGEQLIMARAIDADGRSQPLSPAAHWNPAGYAFNGVHLVNVIVG